MSDQGISESGGEKAVDRDDKPRAGLVEYPFQIRQGQFCYLRLPADLNTLELPRLFRYIHAVAQGGPQAAIDFSQQAYASISALIEASKAWLNATSGEYDVADRRLADAVRAVEADTAPFVLFENNSGEKQAISYTHQTKEHKG